MSPRPPDPIRLVFAAPVISPGEDWRERSLWSWTILARHEGLNVEPTGHGGAGFSGTWCGNVRIDDLLYRVHRAPRLRFRTLDDEGRQGWIIHAATYVEPVTAGVEVLDPRHDRDATIHDLPSPDPPRPAGNDPRIPPPIADLGP
jgi:hypothetical protein